ncbi:hypothetical protein BBJ29_003425 [Phytophthora kernoviae]|uniref:Protein kinase domain-containing protein n=1 Tax=Phytophthora kernoviae TaxID=325452 RepID=A0A3F2RND9_9STRA|nr:hypothetical protein BBP00_00006133 [Phytophthora kernoviae]RLN67129.1 hypothetical protein BBJ29_003425 [Phytophthora kernoviae]
MSDAYSCRVTRDLGLFDFFRSRTMSIGHREELVALKVFKTSLLRKMREVKRVGRRMVVSTALDKVQVEIAIMKKLHHPNLLNLLEVFDDDTETLVLMLEYAPSGQVMQWFPEEKVYKKVKSKGHKKDHPSGDCFSEDELRSCVRQLLLGLEYLHENNICHRDLKPENILVGLDGTFKIADFGVAHFFEDDDNQAKAAGANPVNAAKAHKKGYVSTTAGTYAFMGPETLKGGKYCAYAADIWALGITIHALFFGTIPFYDQDVVALFEQIEKQPIVLEAESNNNNNGVSEDFVELLYGLLEKDPEKRWSLQQCKEHPWVLEGLSEEEKKTYVETSYEAVKVGPEDLASAVTRVTSLSVILRVKLGANKWKRKAMRTLEDRRKSLQERGSSFGESRFSEVEAPEVNDTELKVGAWYACLAPVAAATGNLGVGLYFIAKGFWTALLNIALNRCCLWVAGEKVERGRSLVTSMNVHYGLGCLLGAVLALVLMNLNMDMRIAFLGLSIATLFPAVMIAMLPSPRSYYGRDEHQTLLAFEDPTRRVPTVPSPIVGGVFLHVKHIGRSANCNPDTYDSKNNFIILLVTIFATVLFGIQLGLAAFFYGYIGHVLAESGKFSTSTSNSTSSSTTGESENSQAVWQCAIMVLFWGTLTASYAFFSRYMFHAKNLYSIMVFSVMCCLSSFGILFGADAGLVTFIICIFLFAFALAPLFTLSIHCLTRVINELLIRRVSSLIVFGCGMGEVFIPVLMGFFMSGQSGQTNGAVAVSYITFILAITLVGVSGMLLWMVKARLKELPQEPVDELEAAIVMSTTRNIGHGVRKHNHY